ncbi:MAG: phenylalanyl-tRNA synthetase beta chain [Candidatus Berkelbacteria bacterium Gr01-1014_85]|uniref:phenylalanine--tRNA ligase n=1 Tax=Candidatus Berkelbacteria bacterium Gr01-1014_85 TaxID=2017150 RepID=A0A554JAV9_9BACT|nr:MAG: phenylalanyl-tRNA synthetase beta chain [Candidatus Berkelbacteria bacterium Gr01-1014_85]
MKYSVAGLNQYLTTPLSVNQIASFALELGHSPEESGEDWIELEITANRGDVLSHLGLARELAAASRQPIKTSLPSARSTRRLSIANSEPLELSLKVADTKTDTDLALKLTIDAIDQIEAISLALVSLPTIEVTQASLIKKKLEQYPGQHSINPLVDLSNLLTQDWGIPTHIFDLRSLIDNNQDIDRIIQVKLSQLDQPATYTSLTSQTYPLVTGDLVITDSAGQPIDLVGIQGSRQVKVSQESQLILVAAIVPKASLIRQTSRRLNLITEASYRLERGVDHRLVEPAINRLLEQLTEASGALNAVDTISASRQLTPVKIALIPELFSRSLGLPIDKTDIITSLNRLNLTVQNDQVTVPSYRLDLALPIDLVEEYGRLSGYQKLLPHSLPALNQTTAPSRLTQTHRRYRQIEALKDQLVKLGYTELVTESMAAAENLIDLGWQLDQLVKLAAPQNQQLAYCRPTIISNLLQVASQNNWSDNQLLFEIGTVFPDRFTETIVLTLVSSQKKPPQITLADQDLTAKWQTLRVDQPLAKRLSLRKAVHYLELPVESLLAGDTFDSLSLITTTFIPVSEWPPSVRDLAVIVNQQLTSQQLIEAIQAIEQSNQANKSGRQDSPEIILIDHFDTFKSPTFADDQISYAFHLVYQRRLNQLQPLTNQEVDEAYSLLCQNLLRQFSLTIR